MGSLFSRASSFNQNLCAWGPRLTSGTDFYRTFQNSNCTSESGPNLSSNPPGPLCHICV
jgi:hypothetical protein